MSSISSPSPPRSQGREETGQQLSLQERLRLKEEKKKQAALMKALETPEEKRARRLAKKEAKERKKREKMGWGEEYMGYTNTDNPFGDNNLLGTFIWSKVSSAPCPRGCSEGIVPLRNRAEEQWGGEGVLWRGGNLFDAKSSHVRAKHSSRAAAGCF